jgi:hypothetical protein
MKGIDAVTGDPTAYHRSAPTPLTLLLGGRLEELMQ